MKFDGESSRSIFSLRCSILCLLSLLLLGSVALAQPATPQAQAEFFRIEQLFNDEKYGEAVAGYETFLKQYPNSDQRPEAMLRLARAYAKLARDAEARNTYLALIQADPNGTYATSAVHYMVNFYVERYQHAEAIRLCRQIVSQYPNTRAGLIAAYLIPSYLYAQGKTDEAMKEYRLFLDTYPTSVYRSSVLNMLVTLYIQNRQFDEAEALIQEQLSRQPNDTELLEYLAQLYQKRGKTAEALRLYERVLSQNPDNTNVLEKLGELYAEQGDRVRAIQQWQRIVTTNPNQYYQHQRLADIYKEHRLYDEAIREYETAIRLQPRTSYLYTQLADVYRIQNDTSRAIRTYIRALNVLAPNYGNRLRIYDSLAELYPPEEREQAFLEAEAMVQEYLANPAAAPANNPVNVVNLRLTLAELALHRGDYDLALQRFRQLAQVYQDQGQALQQAAIQLERTYDYLAAGRFYEEITQLFPTSGLTYKARIQSAQAYLKAGHWNQALAVLEGASAHDTAALMLRADIQLHHLHDVHAALATYEQIRRLPGSVGQSLDVILGEAEAKMLLGEDIEPLLQSLLDGHRAPAVRTLLLLGHARFFKGDFTGAAEAYQQVADQDTNSEWSNDALEFRALIRGYQDYFYQPLALYATGLRYEMLGQTSEAIRAYRGVLEQFPESLIRNRTRLALGRLYAQQSDFTRSEQVYREVIAEEGVFAAEALLRLAGLLAVDAPDKAQELYTQLLESYPRSIHAPEARRRLRLLINREEKEGLP